MAYGVNASVAGISVVFAMAWISGFLRGYVRLFLVRKFGLDDWLALASLLLLIGPIACYLIALERDYFDRIPNIEAHGFKPMQQAGAVLFFSQLMYTVGSALIKISFGFTLLRFVQERWQILLIKATIVLEALFATCFFFTYLFECQPVAYSWQRAEDEYYVASVAGIDPKRLGLYPKGMCMPVTQVVRWKYAHASFMIFADVVLGILLPIFVLRHLTLRLSLKMTTCAVLSLGAMASIATIVRLTYIHNLSDLIDFYTIANPCLLWTFMEYAICIIGANCATLKPLARKAGFFSNEDSGPEDGSPVMVEHSPNKAVDSFEDKDVWVDGKRQSVENRMENGRGLVLPPASNSDSGTARSDEVERTSVHA